MNLLLLLDMAAAGRGDETAVQVGPDHLTASELLAAAWTAAATVDGRSALAYAGTNGIAVPVGLFAAAAAGIPFVPLNYRLTSAQVHELLTPLGDVVVVAEGDVASELAVLGHDVVDRRAFEIASMAGDAVGDVPDDADGVAVLLHTSGTTAAPKAAVLRHRHLSAYVIGTVEFGGAEPDEAALVSVPPYHVAGLANLLSNLYLGRRICYLPQFDASRWVEEVRAERITHSMVVPTMLARIVEVLEADGGALPTLRAVSYGGARTPTTVLHRVMEVLPETSFTNAYGLTETSSTIAVLGPDDHAAARSGDAAALARLSSAGKVLPTVEVQVRESGHVVSDGEPGEIWVRGEQVSGEYLGRELSVDAEGWFPTRDRGWVDDDGYLFIEGRSDDTIIRGAENIAPAEIEEVLLGHPDIAQSAVVGVPDEEWGQAIAAAVVLRPGASMDAAGVQDFARRALRGSRTPDLVTFVDSLPYTETGKLLRRSVLSDLITAPATTRD